MLIAPGAYFVLGRNGNIADNGGYSADYVYSNFTLGNTVDQIVLSNDTNELARLNYTELPFGADGVSSELINQLINPDESHYRASQNNQYGLGDTGTPGQRGSFELVSAAVTPVPYPRCSVVICLSIVNAKQKIQTSSPRIASN